MGVFMGLDATAPCTTASVAKDDDDGDGCQCKDHCRVERLPLEWRDEAPARSTPRESAIASSERMVPGGGSAGGTSAVTRSWSDVDPLRMMATLALTSFMYSVLGHPLFLAIARQQCSKTSVSAYQVLSDLGRTYGARGLYRGAGAAVTGTVLSELVYYLVVEYSKEKLPLREQEWRSFGAGFLADCASTPVFNPFGVVSQVQMVAGSSFSSEHNYMSAWRTTLTLVHEQGIRSLFRGTLLTLAVTPLTGAWWFVYELFKRRAYAAAPAVATTLDAVVPSAVVVRLPRYCTSTTDNVLINCGVGAATSIVMGVIMNPVYVLRLRLQVYKKPEGVRFPVLGILKDILAHEGPRALMKGLGMNLFIGAAGGCAFGLTYEGAKKLSDISSTKAAGGEAGEASRSPPL